LVLQEDDAEVSGSDRDDNPIDEFGPIPPHWGISSSLGISRHRPRELLA
jgi:hypothetical protein